MKKSTLLVLIAIVFTFAGKSALAQDYKLAAGLKFHYEAGPSLKYFIQNDVALEGMIGIRSHGVVFSGLWEKHLPAFGVDKLKFYYGFGGHLGSRGKRNDGSADDNNKILFGADGVVGMEYLFPRSPIALSVDLNPRAEVGYGPFFDLSPGIGVKYAF